MANIIIADCCNLKCPYCFADDMIATSNNNHFINYNNFSTILNWLAQTPDQEHIGIIGGEPTLHPMFLDIMSTLNDYCMRMDTVGVLFTNGIELQKYLPYIGERINILVNCNSPTTQSEVSYKKTLETLYMARDLGMVATDKVRVGCNIYLGLQDYSYFWNDIVDKIHPPVVRVSVTSPGGCYMHEWRHQDKKEEYYNTLKPYFMDFVHQAKKRNILLGLDCNQVPPCYFTEEEKQLILSVAETPPMTVCRPPIDINGQLQATSCFGTYDINQENKEVLITDFQGPEDIRRYLFLSRNVPKIQTNNGGGCASCKLHERYQCQGGCLSFADPK